jgi:antitoxin protein of toxin-antitoxin system
MSMFDNLKDKAAEALKSESTTDSALDKAAELINDKTGGQYADKVEQAKAAADDKLGGQ